MYQVQTNTKLLTGGPNCRYKLGSVNFMYQRRVVLCTIRLASYDSYKNDCQNKGGIDYHKFCSKMQYRPIKLTLSIHAVSSRCLCQCQSQLYLEQNIALQNLGRDLNPTPRGNLLFFFLSVSPGPVAFWAQAASTIPHSRQARKSCSANKSETLIWMLA